MLNRSSLITSIVIDRTITLKLRFLTMAYEARKVFDQRHVPHLTVSNACECSYPLYCEVLTHYLSFTTSPSQPIFVHCKLSDSKGIIICKLNWKTSFTSLTLRARIATRSLSSSIPGMTTVIFLGPLKPSTLVSCKVYGNRNTTKRYNLWFVFRLFSFWL